MKNFKYFYLVFTYLMFFFSIHCSNESILIEYFQFPPECKTALENWDYLGEVQVSGSILERNEKQIKVIITDRKKRVLLNDKFTVVGKHIQRVVNWKDFERLEITLLDQDLDLTGDTLRIIKSSAVKNLLYIYNSKRKKFYKKVN